MMENMSSYGAIGHDEAFIDRPLFGVSSTRDRLVNIIGLGGTGLILLVTFLGAFIKPSKADSPAKGYNIYFVICILMICITHAVLVICLFFDSECFREVVSFMAATGRNLIVDGE